MRLSEDNTFKLKKKLWAKLPKCMYLYLHEEKAQGKVMLST